MKNKLSLTFEGSRIEEHGVPVDALVSALQGIQDAMQLMVEHLADYQRKGVKRPKWIKDQSALQLATTRPGSLVAELALNPAATGWDLSESIGEQAVDAFQRWDGGDTSTLPIAVVNRLRRIPNSLPRDVRLWLGNPEVPKGVEIRRRGWTMKPRPVIEEALVYGWLKMVNWDKRTAQLHRFEDPYVPLRFNADLDDEMLRLATQFVEIKGAGLFKKNDQWQWIRVEEIAATRSSSDPFDMEAFLNNPNPKIFDPEKVVTASEPIDVDEFIRIIREGRDA